MELEFSDWLFGMIEDYGWSQSELARRSGLTTASISRIVAGSRGVGKDACIAIAKAFQIPPETVFRAAGMLPPISETELDYEELNYLLPHLSEDQRQTIISLARIFAEQNSGRADDDTTPRVAGAET